MITILDAVKAGQEIKHATPVKLSIGTDAKIYGFVPYHAFETISEPQCLHRINSISSGPRNLVTHTPIYPPIGVVQVMGSRIFYNDNQGIKRLFLFSSVRRPENQKTIVFWLYIPRLIFSLTCNSTLESYYIMFTEHRLDSYSYGLDKCIVMYGATGQKYEGGGKFTDEPYTPWYIPREDEFFFEGKTSLRGVGNAFTVITQRINPQTGTVIYESDDPQDVFLSE